MLAGLPDLAATAGVPLLVGASRKTFIGRVLGDLPVEEREEGTLAVSESQGQFVWTYRINPDGALDAKGPYMTLRRPIDPKGEFKASELPPYLPRSSGDGMTSDTLGRYYVTSALGIQVFDPTGRLCGVVDKPLADKSVTSCVLAGPKREFLYVTSGDRIFRRKVQATGAPIAGAAAIAPR